MTGIISQIKPKLSPLLKLITVWLVVGLSGCSLVVTGYNTAPRWLMVTWINPHLDLNSRQEQQVLSDMQQVLAWHRQTQLPEYIQWLQRMQTLAPQNIQAEQVCGLIEDMRASLPALFDQFEQPTAQLSQTLTPQQLALLKKRLDKDNLEWRREGKLGQSQEAQWDVQVDKGQENAERFYGSLTKAQNQLLRDLVKNSGYEPEKTYQERLRQQSDGLQVLQRIASEQQDVNQTREQIHAWFGRILNTPDPGYAAYLKKRQQLNCEAVAQLHNTTTPAQRAKALRVLKAYEADLRELLKQPS